eukprot:jgi/Bigna1/69882/fgenesh1_pg.10_\
MPNSNPYLLQFQEGSNYRLDPNANPSQWSWLNNVNYQTPKTHEIGIAADVNNSNGNTVNNVIVEEINSTNTNLNRTIQLQLNVRLNSDLFYDHWRKTASGSASESRCKVPFVLCRMELINNFLGSSDVTMRASSKWHTDPANGSGEAFLPSLYNQVSGTFTNSIWMGFSDFTHWVPEAKQTHAASVEFTLFIDIKRKSDGKFDENWLKALGLADSTTNLEFLGFQFYPAYMSTETFATLGRNKNAHDSLRALLRNSSGVSPATRNDFGLLGDAGEESKEFAAKKGFAHTLMPLLSDGYRKAVTVSLRSLLYVTDGTLPTEALVVGSSDDTHTAFAPSHLFVHIRHPGSTCVPHYVITDTVNNPLTNPQFAPTDTNIIKVPPEPSSKTSPRYKLPDNASTNSTYQLISDARSGISLATDKRNNFSIDVIGHAIPNLMQFHGLNATGGYMVFHLRFPNYLDPSYMEVTSKHPAIRVVNPYTFEKETNRLNPVCYGRYKRGESYDYPFAYDEKNTQNDPPQITSKPVETLEHQGTNYAVPWQYFYNTTLDPVDRSKETRMQLVLYVKPPDPNISQLTFADHLVSITNVYPRSQSARPNKEIGFVQFPAVQFPFCKSHTKIHTASHPDGQFRLIDETKDNVHANLSHVKCTLIHVVPDDGNLRTDNYTTVATNIETLYSTTSATPTSNDIVLNPLDYQINVTTGGDFKTISDGTSDNDANWVIRAPQLTKYTVKDLDKFLNQVDPLVDPDRIPPSKTSWTRLKYVLFALRYVRDVMYLNPFVNTSAALCAFHDYDFNATVSNVVEKSYSCIPLYEQGILVDQKTQNKLYSVSNDVVIDYIAFNGSPSTTFGVSKQGTVGTKQIILHVTEKSVENLQIDVAITGASGFTTIATNTGYISSVSKDGLLGVKAKFDKETIKIFSGQNIEGKLFPNGDRCVFVSSMDNTLPKNDNDVTHFAIPIDTVELQKFRETIRKENPHLKKSKCTLELVWEPTKELLERVVVTLYDGNQTQESYMNNSHVLPKWPGINSYYTEEQKRASNDPNKIIEYPFRYNIPFKNTFTRHESVINMELLHNCNPDVLTLHRSSDAALKTIAEEIKVDNIHDYFDVSYSVPEASTDDFMPNVIQQKSLLPMDFKYETAGMTKKGYLSRFNFDDKKGLQVTYKDIGTAVTSAIKGIDIPSCIVYHTNRFYSLFPAHKIYHLRMHLIPKLKPSKAHSFRFPGEGKRLNEPLTNGLVGLMPRMPWLPVQGAFVHGLTEKTALEHAKTLRKINESESKHDEGVLHHHETVTPMLCGQYNRSKGKYDNDTVPWMTYFLNHEVNKTYTALSDGFTPSYPISQIFKFPNDIVLDTWDETQGGHYTFVFDMNLHAVSDYIDKYVYESMTEHYSEDLDWHENLHQAYVEAAAKYVFLSETTLLDALPLSPQTYPDNMFYNNNIGKWQKKISTGNEELSSQPLHNDFFILPVETLKRRTLASLTSNTFLSSRSFSNAAATFDPIACPGISKETINSSPYVVRMAIVAKNIPASFSGTKTIKINIINYTSLRVFNEGKNVEAYSYDVKLTKLFTKTESNQSLYWPPMKILRSNSPSATTVLSNSKAIAMVLSADYEDVIRVNDDEKIGLSYEAKKQGSIGSTDVFWTRFSPATKTLLIGTSKNPHHGAVGEGIHALDLLLSPSQANLANGTSTWNHFKTQVHVKQGNTQLFLGGAFAPRSNTTLSTKDWEISNILTVNANTMFTTKCTLHLSDEKDIDFTPSTTTYSIDYRNSTIPRWMQVEVDAQTGVVVLHGTPSQSDTNEKAMLYDANYIASSENMQISVLPMTRLVFLANTKFDVLQLNGEIDTRHNLLKTTKEFRCWVLPENRTDAHEETIKTTEQVMQAALRNSVAREQAIEFSKVVSQNSKRVKYKNEAKGVETLPEQAEISTSNAIEYDPEKALLKYMQCVVQVTDNNSMVKAEELRPVFPMQNVYERLTTNYEDQKLAEHLTLASAITNAGNGESYVYLCIDGFECLEVSQVDIQRVRVVRALAQQVSSSLHESNNTTSASTAVTNTTSIESLQTSYDDLGGGALLETLDNCIARVELTSLPGFLCESFVAGKKVFNANASKDALMFNARRRNGSVASTIPFLKNMKVVWKDKNGRTVDFRGLSHSFDLEIRHLL